MARRRRKGRRSKGRRRSKKGGFRTKKHKPGVAESVGLLVTGVKTGQVAGPKIVALIKSPSWVGLDGTMRDSWGQLKANAEPAIVGVLVSNADKIPIVGKLIRPFKGKVDRIVKSYTGMKL